MMRKLILPLLVLCAACDDEPSLVCEDPTPETVEECVTEVNVTADQCILLEAVNSGTGHRLVYHHNGENYTSADLYQLYPDDTVLLSTYTMEYHENGYFSKLEKQNENGSSSMLNFDYEDDFVTIHFLSRNAAGEVNLDNSNSYLFVPDSPDTTYYLDYTDLWPGTTDTFIEVQEYRGGNAVKSYEYNEEGTCEFENQRFSVAFHTYYDNRPNVMTPEAFLGLREHDNYYPITNKNNDVAFVYLENGPDVLEICQTLLTNNNGGYWLKSRGGTTYTYDCE